MLEKSASGFSGGVLWTQKLTFGFHKTCEISWSPKRLTASHYELRCELWDFHGDVSCWGLLGCACSVVVGYQCFGGPCCLHLKCEVKMVVSYHNITRRHSAEDFDLRLLILFLSVHYKSRDSSVGIALGYGLDDRGSRFQVSILGGGWEFFSSPPRPERLWDPPGLPSLGYKGLFP
jgi:hypothetical protein